MSNYRVVVRHVRYWRSKIHKWSTVYQFSGTASSSNYPAIIAAIHSMEQDVLYPGNTPGQGAIWEIALYNSASGGVPVSVATYCDPATPSSWVDYLGAVWPDLTHVLETSAEVSLTCYWLAGLSVSGKPVRYRKWYHSVPVSTAVNGNADLASGTATAIKNRLQSGLATVSGLGLTLGSGSRLAGTTPTVQGDYGNHQMPRGRRRKPTKISSQDAHLPPGLLVVPGSDGSLEG